MLNCPFCNSDLTKYGLNQGQCPSCGGMLRWDEASEDNAPLPSGEPGNESDQAPNPLILEDKKPSLKAILATIVGRGMQGYEDADSDDRPPRDTPPPAEEPPVVAKQVAVERSPTAAAPPSGPAAERPEDLNVGKTIDARQLSPEELQSVAELWENAIDPEVTSRMTLKGDAGTTAVGTKVVIPTRQVAASEATGLVSADYHLLKLIGEGGVGVVYSARQTSVNRNVAVKMLHAEIKDDLDHRAKFVSEAVVTGDLDHPNIVPIHDLGSDETGALFYSMKRVKGTPWSEALPGNSVSENLSILMNVADAIAFAHSRGIIHRDLKPENVMLGDFGEVLVMDWGIALSTPLFLKSDSIATSNSMGGTPAYMAPEMATGPIEAIGARSDIYLLGGILFEMIAGSPPHTGRGVMDCVRAAARNEVQPTDKSGELLEIAYRAMATDPKDRYGSVQEFQSAIRQYQAHSESIILSDRAEQSLVQAGSTRDYQDYSRALFAYQEAVGIWEGNTTAKDGIGRAQYEYARCAYEKGDYDLGVSLLNSALPDHATLIGDLRRAQQERETRHRRLKTARRSVVALAALVFVVVVTGFFYTSKKRKDAEDARDDAIIAEAKARDAEATARDAETTARDAEAKARDAEATTREAQLDALGQARIAKQQRAAAVTAKAKAEAASYLAQIGLASERIANNAFLDADRLLTECKEPNLAQHRNWEWRQLRYLCRLDYETLAVDARIESVCCSQNGKYLAVGAVDGLVRVWDTESQMRLPDLLHGDAVNAVAMTSDGRHIASGGERSPEIKIWTLSDDGLRYGPPQTISGHRGAVLSLRFSHDDRLLLSSSRDGTARLWNWELVTGEGAEAGKVEIMALRGHIGPVYSAAFSPQDSRIVTAGDDSTVRVWSGEGEQLTRFDAHEKAVFAAEFCPKSEKIASAGWDKRILVWDPDEVPDVFESVKREYGGDESEADATQEQPSNPEPHILSLDGHTAEVRSLVFAEAFGGREATFLISGGHDNTVRVWNLECDPSSLDGVQVFRGHGGWVRCVDVLPSTGRIVSGSFDKQLKIWDAQQYSEVRSLRDRQSPVTSAALTRDGRRAIVAGDDGTAVLWNVEEGQIDLLEDASRAAEDLGATSPSSDPAPELKEGHQFLVSAAAFCRQGDRLATNAGDGTTRLWDVDTGGEIRCFEGTGQGDVLALSEDGRWMLTGSESEAALLWDTENPQTPPVTLDQHKYEITAVALSEGGELARRFIVTCDAGGMCNLWKWDDREKAWIVHAKLVGHLPEHAITAARFVPGKEVVLTASQDHTVMQWDVKTGRRIDSLTLKHPDSVRAMDISRDGKTVVTISLLPPRAPNEQSEENETEKNDRDRDYKLWVWDRERPEKELASQLLTVEMATSIALDPLGAYALISATDLGTGSVWRWNLGADRPRLLWGDRHRSGAVWSTLVTPDGGQVLTVGSSRARLWETGNGEFVKSFSHHGALTCSAFSPSGQLAVTADAKGDIKIWSVDKSAHDYRRVRWKISQAHKKNAVAYSVNSAVFFPRFPRDDRLADKADEALLLTTGDDGTAKLWQIRDKQPELLATYVGHSDSVRAAVFSPDGRQVATASLDGTVRLWDASARGDVSAQRTIGGQRTHTLGVTCLDFSPDGGHLATGSENNTIKIWDLRGEQKEPLFLEGHTASITSISFSPDGRRLVSGSRDSMAKVWDAESGNQLLNLNRHSDEVTSAVFAARGDHVLTASRDKTAIFWLAAPNWPTIVLSEGDLAYETVGQAAVVDEQVELKYADASRLAGGTLRAEMVVSDGGVGADDHLAIRDQGPGQGNISLAGLDVQFEQNTGPVVIGTLEDQGADLEVTLNEQATLASLQALLRSITFTASAPVDTPCAVRFQLIAPDGRMTSNLAEKKITPPAIATGEEESESGPEALSSE